MELEKLTKELKKKKGNVIGELLILNRDYIYEKEGSGGVKKVEDKIKELTGLDFKFNEINRFSWNPQWINVLIIVVCREIFKWTDDDIFEMGGSTAKVSFVLKSISYLNSLEEIVKKAPIHWKRFYDFGGIEIVEFSKNKKFSILRLSEFHYHSDLCLYTAGYFLSIFKFFVRGKDMKIQEINCSNKGGDFDDYKISWE